MARSRRMPSTSVLRFEPLRSASMVWVSSAAGANAATPSGELRTVAGLPWPFGLKVQPSRPRPMRTQPPPLVVMSQKNWAGRSMAGVSSQ